MRDSEHWVWQIKPGVERGGGGPWDVLGNLMTDDVRGSEMMLLPDRRPPVQKRQGQDSPCAG